MRSFVPALLALAAALALAGARPAERLPAIVFVSRAPLAEPGAIPGFGPHHRASAPGGRLMIRERDGAVRALLAPGAFHDVSDPAVSPDGRRVAFAATGPSSRWRIYVVRLADGAVTPVTGGAPGGFDDLDPCWVTDRLLCFASTRVPLRAQYAGVPATNLWLAGDDGRDARRITAERNGADEPVLDPRTGEILYSRWWFNPWVPDAGAPDGMRRAASATPDSVNLWHLVAIAPDRRGPRLAAGAASPRRDACAYQAAVLGDRVLAAYAANLGLSPAPGATGVHELARASDAALPVLGAIVPESGADPYRGASGLAAPSACAPAMIGDGRALVSWSPGARGDFGIHVVRDGEAPVPVVDFPGTLELDAAPVVARRTPAAARAWERVPGFGPAADRALAGGAVDDPALGSFVFDCADVFAGAGAPPRTPGAKLRFYAALPGRDGADEQLVMLREAAVGARGEVRAELPAGVPLFETLVGADGAVLRAAHGPAHVAGSNAGAPGGITRCVGCHAGHSRLSP